MKKYTVNQLAKLSGVSVRALHHYDALGLLVPAFLGENAYRYYGEAELLRLQQILFHREFGIPLKDIAALLEQSGQDRVAALAAHRARLEGEVERYRLLVATIDRTIAALNTDGVINMEHADLYKGFDSAKQAAYEREIAEEYGEQVVQSSRARIDKLSPQQRQAKMDELAEIEAGVAACLQTGLAPDTDEVAALMARHHAWVEFMWNRPCPMQAYAGLADMYQGTPDFRTRYETLAQGLTDYLATAMRAYAQ